jgi:hypothetical protein
VELLDQGLRVIQVFLALPAVLRRRLSRPLDKVEPLAIANLCAHNILGLELAVFFLGLGLDRGRIGLERRRLSLDRSRLGLDRRRVGLGILILLCGLCGTIRYSCASILFMLSEYSSDKMGRKARRGHLTFALGPGVVSSLAMATSLLLRDLDTRVGTWKSYQ